VRKHYIHKPGDALIAAADRISSPIATALDGKPVSKPDRSPLPPSSSSSGHLIAQRHSPTVDHRRWGGCRRRGSKGGKNRRPDYPMHGAGNVVVPDFSA
jgi:hypothetical protein